MASNTGHVPNIITSAMLNAQIRIHNNQSHDVSHHGINVFGTFDSGAENKILSAKNSMKGCASNYCDTALSLYFDKKNLKGYHSIDSNRSIFYTRITSITTNAGKKSAPNATKLNKQERGLYSDIQTPKIKAIYLNCSVFEERASDENIKKMQKFFKDNKCEFSVINNASVSVEFEFKRLLNLYKDDISGNNDNDLTNIETLINGVEFFKAPGIDKEVSNKLLKRKEFQIKIDFSQLPEGVLKTALTEHFNQKVKANGKEINQFSQDITNIIEQSFQQYLEKNKLTFNANNPGNNLSPSNTTPIASHTHSP